MRNARFFALAVLPLLASVAGASPEYTARWVLAHDPSVAAETSARGFAARLEKATDGEVRVEVIKAAAYNEKAGRFVSHRELTQHLADGRIEMTQMYTAGLARYDVRLRTLSNPYLFRDYEHAEAVFEGPLGAKFLAAVPPSSGMRALGVTYSGGFGIFATKDREVRKPEDMRGLKLQSDRFSWLSSYTSALGVEPVSAPPEAFVPLAERGFADAVETTVARFDEYGDDRAAKVVIGTDHFLLTTMIVVNEKFYQSLPEKHRATLRALAQEAAREERALSIKANEDGRARLERRGVRFIDLTPAEKRRFADALKPVYDLRWSKAGAEWASAIRAARAARTAAR